MNFSGMNFHVKWACCLTAGCLAVSLLSGAEAARHAADTGSSTVVNTARTGAVVYTDRSAAREARAQRHAANPVAGGQNAAPSDQVMRLWNVEAADTGGTLLFSDSPEYVQSDGIMYADTVQGDARVLFYHLNDTDEPKRVAVVLENTTDKYTSVEVTRGGMSEPSSYYLQVGKQTQTEYFDTKMKDSVLLLGSGFFFFFPVLVNFFINNFFFFFCLFDF